jgi:hypothetical protein
VNVWHIEDPDQMLINKVLKKVLNSTEALKHHSEGLAYFNTQSRILLGGLDMPKSKEKV